jgi:hypothetical protein
MQALHRSLPQESASDAYSLSRWRTGGTDVPSYASAAGRFETIVLSRAPRFAGLLRYCRCPLSGDPAFGFGPLLLGRKAAGSAQPPDPITPISSAP